jgi:DNA-binding CsgD family transcriptional regulator
MSRLAPLVRALRSLPAERCEEVLAHVRDCDDGITPDRRNRHWQVLRRHVFSGEPASVVRKALGISAQRFYEDRHEAIRRAMEFLEDRSPRTAFSTSSERRIHALLAQARSLYGLGLSEQALDVLHDVSDGALEPHERLDAIVLTIDALDDLSKLDRLPRIADRTGTWLATAAPDTFEHRVAAIAADWALGRLCYQRNDHHGFVRSWEAARRSLLDLTERGDRSAAKQLCRLWNTVVPIYGDWFAAEGGLRESQEIASRLRLPLAIEAELRAYRAYVHAQDPATAKLAYSELQEAYALAIEHAPQRVVWLCLSFDVSESIYRGDNARAVASASTLFESVRSCESIEWKRFAASCLINAYMCAGRLADAERVAALDGEYGLEGHQGPVLAFGRCVLLFKQGLYAQSLALADELKKRYERSMPWYLRANVLLYRAQAAYFLGEVTQAHHDIEEALATYQKQSAPHLFILRSAYRAAYEITGQRTYYDRFRELTPELEGSVISIRQEREGIALTARQREIAWLAAEGATNREIAERLGISHRTVGNHLDAVFTYLGVHARHQLADALHGRTSP